MTPQNALSKLSPARAYDAGGGWTPPESWPSAAKVDYFAGVAQVAIFLAAILLYLKRHGV